jgi:hypothetical protein
MAATVNPPPVVAVSYTPASMGPPPIPPHRTALTGPDVAIPTSWQGSTTIPSRITGPIGYSSHHAMYSTERQRWAKVAYAHGNAASAIAEMISLEISAVHEGGSRKKMRGVLIGVREFLFFLN